MRRLRGFQQLTGIEPASPAWEAGVLPMNYNCISVYKTITELTDKIKLFLALRTLWLSKHSI